MDLHPLFRTAGISVSFGEVSCQVTILLQIHFYWSIFRKIQSLFHEKDFSHGMKTSQSMREGGLLFSGGHRVCSQLEGKKGAVFLFPLWGFLLCFHLSRKSLHFLVSHLWFFFIVCYLSFTSPLLYQSSTLLMFVWTSPLLSASSVAYSSVSGARKKVGIHSFCWVHASLWWFFT